MSNEMVNNTAYLNILRVYAAFVVIIIHVFSIIILYSQNSLTETESYICAVLLNLLPCRTPIFVMITGVLFLNPAKEISPAKILKRYFFRIILAIILFGLPYCFIELLFEAQMSFNIGMIGNAILNTIQGKSWDHMWFLYMIAGMYLCIPLIKQFVVNASQNTVKYILVILFVFTGVIPCLESVIPFQFGIDIPIYSVYVFYLLLGYYIHYHQSATDGKILWAILIAYLFYVIVMPLFTTLSSGAYIIFTNHHSPITMAVSFSVFTLVSRRCKPSKAAMAIAPLCFGIYLIHPLFIHVIYKLIKFTPERYPLIIVIVATILAVTVLSASFSYFARKITIIKKYVL